MTTTGNRALRHSLAGLLLLLGAARAGEETQIDWVGDWDRAFALAAERKCPVMVCINSKDGEEANERAARETYRDAEFVALSRSFVMVAVSTLHHGAPGPCVRFGKITCDEHRGCYKELRSRFADQFVLPGGKGEMISPQHAWFRPDGTLLRKKEYELTKPELVERMNEALKDAPDPADPAAPAGPGTNPADAPLVEKDLAELARVKGGEREARAAALGNLLATGKSAAVEALLEIARKGDEKLRFDIVKAFGRGRVLLARPFVEEFLKDREASVRSCAAVALERMAQRESIEPLLKRVKTEGDTAARRNAYRALGVCGGAAGDKEAGKALLRGLKDKHQEVGRHAALGLRSFEGPAAALVLKPLEQAALAEKSREVRGAMIFTLAFIGRKDTTIPVLRRILEESPDELARAFVRQAIGTLEGSGGGFGESARWLFREDRDDPARQD
jgi:HEAT repeat protein